jgi:YVTN family beta-propeller protein
VHVRPPGSGPNGKGSLPWSGTPVSPSGRSVVAAVACKAVAVAPAAIAPCIREDGMNIRISGLIAVFVAACLLGSAQSLAQNAYITNFGEPDHTVSVVDTATNAVIATIPVGDSPFGVAVSPDGSKVYVTNLGSASVSVIDAATNTVTATIPVGLQPSGVAVTPDGSKLYVANEGF